MIRDLLLPGAFFSQSGAKKTLPGAKNLPAWDPLAIISGNIFYFFFKPIFLLWGTLLKKNEKQNLCRANCAYFLENA